MAEKRIYGRAVQKHDLEKNWIKATNFIPMAGEIIVYDRDDNVADESLKGTCSYERIKIGDGVQNVNDLPFYSGSWNELSDKPFGSEGLITVEWDGDTTGLPVSSDGTVYKVSDLKPTSTEVIGGKLTFSRGNVEDITSDIVANHGYIISIYYNTILINTSNGSAYDYDLSVTLPEPGIYFQKNAYSQLVSFSYGSETVYYLDEKYIPNTIARVSDVESIIDAIPTPDVSGQIEEHNTSESAHSDIRTAISDVNKLIGDTPVSDQISDAISKIPTQVQANWDETDETSLAYVKNKTHGVEKVNVVAIEEQDATFILRESLYMAEVQGAFSHELETIAENGFTVIWDGNVYQKSLIIYDEEYFIGNLSILTNNEDDNTEEPFVFMCFPDGCIVVCQQSEGITHRVGLSYLVESIQKIDIKFLPNDLAFKSEIPTVPTNISAFVNDVDYIALGKGNEKTFEFVRDETYSGDHFIYNAFDYYKVSDFAPSYDDVVAVRGTWYANGNESIQTTIMQGTSCYHAGHSIVVTEPGQCSLSNISFRAPSSGIYFKKSSDTYYQTKLSITCAYKCLDDSIIPDTIARTADIPKQITVDDTLSNTSTNPVQNKVVNEAILNINTLIGDTPVADQINTALVDNQANWNQNDSTKTDYIKNRPFYSENPVEQQVLENTSLDFDGDDAYFNDFSVSIEVELLQPLEPGVEYIVTFNGKEYRRTAFIDGYRVVVGNAAFVAGSDTGEPFLITTHGGVYADICVDHSNRFVHTFSIVAMKVNVHKIDIKYIPDCLMPKTTYVELVESEWIDDGSLLYQVVEINGITANSKVDLQPTAYQILDLQNNDIAFILENDDGVVTAYCLGGRPTKSYSMQVLITEVIPV